MVKHRNVIVFCSVNNLIAVIGVMLISEYHLLAVVKKDKNKTVVSKKKVSVQPVVSTKNEGIPTRDMTLSWPLNKKSFWLSSLFGPRKKKNGAPGFHYGIDLAASKGTPVYAACSGIVQEAGFMSGYGNTIVIAHNRKYKTRYAHLNKISVKVGAKVKRGGTIGEVGDTGFVRKKGKDASHLHFELCCRNKKINPIGFLE